MKSCITALFTLLIFISHMLGQANMAAVSTNENLSNGILCPNENLLMNILGPVTPPADMSIPGVTYDPGIAVAVFQFAPTYINNEILNDPALLGFIELQNQSAFFDPISISYDQLINLLPPPVPSNLSTTTPFFIQVVNYYSIINNVPYVNGTSGLPDIDASTIYTISLQPKATISSSEDCVGDALNCQISIPGLSSGNVSLANNYPNSVTFPNNIGYNQNFSLTGLTENSFVGFEYTNFEGCTIALDTFYVGMVTATINNSISTLCENAPAAELFASPTTGIWTCSNPLMLAGNFFNPSAQDISTTTNYSVTYTPTSGDTGCNTPASMTITVEPEVVAQITGPNSMCNNASIQSYSSSIPGGVWNTDFNAIDQNGNLNPQLLSPGIHTINYTPVGSCVSSSMFDIVIDFLPNLHFTIDTSQGCVPLLIQFTDLTPGNISDRHWIIEGVSYYANSANYAHVFENPYCYNVGLASLNDFGCRDTLWRTNYICPFDNPYMSFGFMPQQPDIAEPEVNFYAGNTSVNSVVWDFGDGTGSVEYNPLHYFANTVPAEFKVCLTGIDSNQCATEVCEFVTVGSGFKLYMPNAYTPDQDGLNDGFRPVMDSKREIAKFQMSIFNRDGEKIYESEDMNQAWYGNSNDSNFYVKDGVYIWKIKVWLNGDVEPKEYSGNVIIVR